MRYLIAVLFSLVAAHLSAAPIEVRSGEHGSFSRLVIYLQNAEDWKIDGDEQLKTLTVEGWNDGFDISSVFNRINTNRIKALASSDGSLTISLGCDCEIAATRLQGGLVSLDISEISADRVEPKPRPIETNAPETSEPQTRQPVLLPWPTVFETSPNLRALDRTVERILAAKTDMFEAQLSDTIVKGRVQKHLTSSDLKDALQDKVPRSEQTKTFEELLGQLDQRARLTGAGKSPDQGEIKAPRSCPREEDFAISEWGGDMPFSDELASVRASLFSEFDAVDPQAVRKLARLFVHYGLGPEAQNSAKLLDNAPSSQRLIYLADVVGGGTDEIGPLSDQLGCGGETAFWSLVAGADAKKLSQDQVEAIVATFQRLPFHLQSMTADRVISSFEDSDSETAAGIIRNTLQRASGENLNHDEVPPLMSDLDQFSRVELMEIIERNDATSPTALVRYVGLVNERGEVLRPDFIDLSGAYIHQLSGSEIARDLLSGRTLALAISGDRTQAVNIFFKTPQEEFSDVPKLANDLMHSLITSSDPAQVSRFFWLLKVRSDLALLSDDVLLSIADFFLHLEQPELALNVISHVKKGETAAEISVAAQVQLGEYDAAVLGILTRADDVKISKLASARLNADPAISSRIRPRLEGALATQSDWFNQNWSAVPEGDERYSVSTLLAKSLNKTADARKPIANAQTSFSESQEARKLLNELLF